MFSRQQFICCWSFTGVSPINSAAHPATGLWPVEVGSASVNGRASGSLSQGLPSDLSEINEKATQPHLKKFPDRDISGKTQSFSSRWYDKFKWIEYSRFRDAIFCKACRHFSGSQTEYSFVRHGFPNMTRPLRQGLKSFRAIQHS